MSHSQQLRTRRLTPVLCSDATHAPHGGGRRRVPLVDVQEVNTSPEELLALDDALARFAADEPAKAELVKLRFYARMSNPEAAAALGISVSTAERWWAFARTWLYADLADAAPEKTPEA